MNEDSESTFNLYPELSKLKVTLLTVEKRKGLLGKLLPERKILRKKSKFSELPNDTKEKIETYVDYMGRMNLNNLIYSKTIKKSACDKATEALEPFMILLYAKHNPKMVIGRLNFSRINKWLNFELYYKQ